MAETRLSFKDMCARFDVTPRTLRYYEYIELLQPEKDGRARFYGPREVARMTLILRGRRFGFSLEEIRQWLLIYETEGHQRRRCRRWLDLADRQLAELRPPARRTGHGDFRSAGPARNRRQGDLTHLAAASAPGPIVAPDPASSFPTLRHATTDVTLHLRHLARV